MSCQNLQELRKAIRDTTYMDYAIFSKMMNVNPSTYYRWSSKTNDQLRTASELQPFYDLMEGSFDEYNHKVACATARGDTVKTDRISLNAITEISMEDWERLQVEHYLPWKKILENASEKRPLAHFSTISAVVKLLRWQDGQAAHTPLYSKRIKRGASRKDVKVNDESFVYRYAMISRPIEAIVRARMITSGEPEAIFHVPGQVVSTDDITDSMYTVIQFDLSKSHKQLFYGARVFNGYQFGNEEAFVRVMPDTTADHLSLVVDFTSVIGETPFTSYPYALYEDVKENFNHVECSEHSDGKIWHAEYHNPEPGSRIGLHWSIIKS